ncbi:MAG: Isoleucyl-tRNA synthetase [Xanthobacteraceae bacterium]|nr:MAG: Isoleucyl-tRNA synthetase [Xanthobacteraceae bacterium]
MTWSIIARDEPTGAIGIAVATRFFAVGALLPHIDPAAGAVATQALINPTYGPRGLRLLREGVPADEVVRFLTASDAGESQRQLHVMDKAGRFAAHTGSGCVDWCGHAVHDGFSVAGNMLAGPDVIAETARAFRNGKALPFARRLITALKAGEAAGGDKRGKQSASLLIHEGEEYPSLSLRVDDHADPLAELERLETVSRERFVHFARFFATKDDPSGTYDRAVINAAIEAAVARDAGG